MSEKQSVNRNERIDLLEQNKIDLNEPINIIIEESLPNRKVLSGWWKLSLTDLEAIKLLTWTYLSTRNFNYGKKIIKKK